MDKDVLYNKIEIIERCLIRIKEVYADDQKNLEDYTKQDSIVLNIQRAIEASIDIAMHIVSEKKLGIPKSSRGAFEVLEHNKIINNEILKKLKNMVGFRNIAVHNYRQISLDILQKIVETDLDDFNEFICMINKTI